MKKENLKNREMLGQFTSSIMFLERAHVEMKCFISKTLNEIFRIVRKKQAEIGEAIIQHYPEGLDLVKSNKDNALGLYCYYLRLIKPSELERDIQFYKEDIEELEQKVKVRETEYQTQKVILDMYIKREQNYQDEILLLQRDLADVKQQLKEEIERNREEKERMIK